MSYEGSQGSLSEEESLELSLGFRVPEKEQDEQGQGVPQQLHRIEPFHPVQLERSSSRVVRTA